ncbi:MAG: hypothetical protein PHO02_04250 [Candidatus Nanoarchaeia archaeon]|nr:hypothetical protein [Candidatus Nanoarchaeia archaeon]
MKYCVVMKMPGLGDVIAGENEKPYLEKDPAKLEQICLKALETKTCNIVSIREYKGKDREGFLLGNTYKTYSL